MEKIRSLKLLDGFSVRLGGCCNEARVKPIFLNYNERGEGEKRGRREQKGGNGKVRKERREQKDGKAATDRPQRKGRNGKAGTERPQRKDQNRKAAERPVRQ